MKADLSTRLRRDHDHPWGNPTIKRNALEAADALDAQAREIEAWKAAAMIANGYKDSPCFAELLGEVDEDRPCGCPVCGLRAIIALATPSTPEETSR